MVALAAVPAVVLAAEERKLGCHAAHADLGVRVVHPQVLRGLERDRAEVRTDAAQVENIP